MRRSFAFLSLAALILSVQAVAALPTSEEMVSKLVLRETDADFSGYYLDIEKTMEVLNVSRLTAHEIQNQMRDELQTTSNSVAPDAQKPYLRTALANAVDNVLRKFSSQNGFKPIDFKKGEFIVVFDLDETLVTHWYKKNQGEGLARQGSLALTVRDSVPNVVDKATGNSVAQPRMLYSGNLVQLRPNSDTLFKALYDMPGFKGIVLFTAKEDRAAEDLIRVWKKKFPADFKRVKGIFGRNHLRIGQGLKKPSKDLRIFDETLKHVVLIDDNESRVMQKDLCYMIPKFNADGYLDAFGDGLVGADDAVLDANFRILPYVGENIGVCAKEASLESADELTFSTCFTRVLGKVGSTPDAELGAYSQYLKANGTELEGEKLKHAFEQPFEFEIARPLTETFPQFQGGSLVKPLEF